MNFPRSLDSIWLTDPTVPNARPVWATRLGKDKPYKTWIPQEDSMWLDLKTGIIYLAAKGEITDFASTPAGDGHKGVLRGAGRLHDLMGVPMTVLKPATPYSVERLKQFITQQESAGQWVTIVDCVRLGYTIDEQHEESIWSAGDLYARSLIAGGFPQWRAYLQRFGLRGLGLQHAYRFLTKDRPWLYQGERTD